MYCTFTFHSIDNQQLLYPVSSLPPSYGRSIRLIPFSNLGMPILTHVARSNTLTEFSLYSRTLHGTYTIYFKNFLWTNLPVDWVQVFLITRICKSQPRVPVLVYLFRTLCNHGAPRFDLHILSSVLASWTINIFVPWLDKLIYLCVCSHTFSMFCQ